MSARGYYLFKVTERRCAVARSFNSMLDEYYSGDESSEVLKQVKVPLSPPRYGRDVYRKKVVSCRAKFKQAPVDENGGGPKSGDIAKSSRPRADAVIDDRRQAAEGCVRGRQLRKGNENQERSTSFNRGASVRARRSCRSRTPLRGCVCSSSGNGTGAVPAPPKDLSPSPSLASTKPSSEHRPPTASMAEPALPKVPTKTTPSTMLQRSARVYRLQKTTQSVGAVPQPRIELKPTPSFETPDLLDLKHTTSTECTSFEDDVSLAATLFSVESIDNALSMGDVGTKESSQSSKAIENLKDAHPRRNRSSRATLKQRPLDDHSVASTVGISHSMSEDSTNVTKCAPSQLGPNSKMPMKQTKYSGLARAARLRQRSVPRAPMKVNG